MPVEIRELKIKGIVSNSSFSRNSVFREFENQNSTIIKSSLLRNLKEDILSECKEYIANELERQNQR
jgi:hypothetical protein